MGKTIYVDADAAGANDGTSWTDAYNFLQNALADADVAEKPVEIRVAQGTYRPNQGLMAISEFDWRTTTFQLTNGVTLKGGYGGFGEPHPNVRNIETYETILSGDLDGDDVEVADPCDLLGEPTRVENSYHVLTAQDIESDATLHGFTIVGGNANGEEDKDIYGGGLYCNNSFLSIISCTFQGNTSVKRGGAIHNHCLGELIITNCKFIRNASMWGGALYNGCSNPTLTDCIFTENYSSGTGGAVHNSRGAPLLINCKFEYNSSCRGGGMYNFCYGDTTLIDCTFIGNFAEDFGGGMYNKSGTNVQLFFGCTFKDNYAVWYGGGLYNTYNSKPVIKNCLFIGNSTSSWGGALHFFDSNAEVSNCTLVNNSAVNGGAVGCGFGGESEPSNVKLTNCILWGNDKEIYIDDDSQVTITYSCIQDLKLGRFGLPAGNINQDPCFVDPGRWVNANGPNAVWIDGDYHLKSEVGRWDPDSQTWVQDDVTSPCIDAGDPNSDWTAELWPHGESINMGAYGGTSQASMSLSDAGKLIYIQWLGHSTVKVWTDDCVVYVDPERVNESLHDATLVCVTHTHGDHYSPSDIARVSNSETQFIAPPDVVQRYGSGEPIAPGQTIQLDGVSVTAVPAYNTNKPNHPKSRNWVGFVIELASKRIYVAGDTDLTDEMKALEGIDAAILPAGGTYTMNAVEAAEATQYIKPELAIPYHWGQNIGTLSDAETFAQKAACAVKIMTVGETISSDNWPEYSPLIAHWKLDETEGSIAYDSAGDNSGTLNGNPLWRPAGGKVDGALEFDGTDDYVSADFVLNPADDPFSIFAWIKGGTPGQAVISQTGEANWLSADASDGKLMTELRHIAGRVVGPPLWSQTVITDGDWHHVGFVWDGSNRILYADGVEVATDTQTGLGSSDGGLYIGAGKNLEPDSFFSGLIDDIGIYNQALSAEEIAALAR